MIRVVIIADIRLYREGLAQLLAHDPLIAVAAMYADSRRALAELAQSTPNVVLLDMANPESWTTARELGISAPAVRIVALGISDSDADAVACAEMGVAGYVTREGSVEELVDTLHRAVKGELICTPRTAGTLARRLATLAAVH